MRLGHDLESHGEVDYKLVSQISETKRKGILRKIAITSNRFTGRLDPENLQFGESQDAY